MQKFYALYSDRNFFFSCSEGIAERDSNEVSLTSVNKANYKMAAAVPVVMNSWMAGLQDNISIAKYPFPEPMIPERV